MAPDPTDLGEAVKAWLREREEKWMIRTFDKILVPRFGLPALKSHENYNYRNNHPNGIAHDLVKRGKLRVLVHLVETHNWDVNGQRRSDLNTPLHLALWHGQHSVAERLLQMRADASIQNIDGEDASALSSKEDKPIRALLQGALTAEDILQLTDSKLEAFDGIDAITAYFNVARMSADFDPLFNSWKGDKALMRLGAQASFRKLARACTDVLCRASDPESGARWATMLHSLAMLPDRGVICVLARWVEANGLPLGAARLPLVAWGMAKLEGGGGLWAASYESLGTQLSRCIGEMQERHVSMAVWAFAKAGARAGGGLLQHPELFEAVARFLHERGDSMSSPQSVSNIAWSFAKLGERYPQAFSRLASVASRMIDRFDCQHVANTAWAYARLGLAEESLFRDLMQRADATLYEDMHRNHVRLSKKIKDIHWAMVYQAYCFCCEKCPAAIASLSRRLATDLQKIDVQDRREGLSEGSGVESVERRLDEIIAEQEEVDAAGGGHGAAEPSVPADSLEAAFGAAPPAQGWVTVVVLKFKRSPECWRKALLEGPELAPVRDALEAAGRGAILPQGAKVFVRPEHHDAVQDEVRCCGMQLYTSHVLVAEEFEGAVHQALANLRSSERVVLGQRSQFTARAWEELSVEWKINVKRTFLCVSVPPSTISEGSMPHARSV